MRSMLETPGARLKLLLELRRRGLYVHMHAYEYILGYGGRIVGVVLLEPWRGTAELYAGEELPPEVLALLRGALREVDPHVKLLVVSTRVERPGRGAPG
ncbi:hypothetical protein IG193_01155 [Infirmifilum lucidum]|uniref:Uncharacterized protein n=1 Tax=Infirmifilum lucidum TaxID=2776706 RepID=A0A7L9FJJ7_9CREN|nr:hypothetical protein [Infirmifilum lucidum]QOJ79104.1 hypothetical protein IG193_01155 [Infirmifilum lucidum]